MAHPDPFLRSMALWILKDYSGSLNTLLLNNVGHNHPAYIDDDPLMRSESQSANPNVFNFYIYLRTHPLLIRQYIASTAQEKKKAQVVLSGFSYSGDGSTSKSRGDKQVLIEDSITPLERQLYFTTAHGHFKAGCPALALEVLSKLPSKVIEPESGSTIVSPNDEKHAAQIDSGILDWGQSEKPKEIVATNGDYDWSVPEKASSIDWGAPEKADSFDWGAPVSKVDSDELKLDWDDGNKSDDDESDTGLGLKLDLKEASVEPPSVAHSDTDSSRTETLDIMAQQLKFVACLKILMEELSTLATGFEVDGGQLRYQLYVWLEKEVEALRQLCSYSSADIDLDIVAAEDINEQSQVDASTSNPKPVNEKPTLHEILMQEKLDFEAKVHRAARRKRWLKGKFCSISR